MSLFLTEKEVVELLPMTECIDVLEKAFSYVESGLAETKPRYRIRLPGRFPPLYGRRCHISGRT